MNKLLTTVRRPKFYVPVIIALVAVVGYLSLPKSRPVDTNTALNTSIDKKTADKYDKQKIDNMYDMVTTITATYAQERLRFPVGNEGGWADIIATVPTDESFIDPYTQTMYGFADDDANPDFGQVQYKPGAACDTKTQTFKEGTFRTIALRTRLYNTYHCVSSIEVQARADQTD
jgi:hypothetical protein